MRPIETKLYSPHLRRQTTYDFKPGFVIEKSMVESWVKADATVSKIRLSTGYPVSNFRDLVEQVALVTLANKNYEMFYRGQSADYRDKNGKSTIYPTICRPGKRSDGKSMASIKRNTIIERYKKLDELIKIYSQKRVSINNELFYSLFQHYDIADTPLVDITQSLRVAATFALQKSKTELTEQGYLYVFGLPYPNGSVSYFFDEQILLIKLQNICPPKAYRPRYQEGYLVGKFPIRNTKEAGDNLARRMVAKFKLNNSNGDFWDNNFTQMPIDVLFPVDDKYADELNTLKLNYLNNLNC